MITYYSFAKPIITIINRVRTLIALLAVVSLLAEYGFNAPKAYTNILIIFDLSIVLFYVLSFLLRIGLSTTRLQFIRRYWFESLLVLLILLNTTFIIHSVGFNAIHHIFLDINVHAVLKTYIAVTQLLLMFTVIAEIARHNKRISYLKFHPSQTLVLSFLIVILTGTGFLMLPGAVRQGMDLSFMDALFTATSATCVTGLVVVDTGSTFSYFGQVVILSMIQIGGLGIMTFSSFFALLFGAGVGIRERVMLNDMLNIEKLGTIVSILRNAVIITFVLELIGAVLLLSFWELPAMPLRDQIYFALFHSVSAFCNAGFSLFSDSLVGYRQSGITNLLFMILIVLGGLGFTVLMDMGAGKVLRAGTKRKISRFRIQTRLVVGVSTILILSGTILIYIFEGGNVDWLTALFTSVTARTAGFNTIDMSALSTATLLLMMALMFIGASPGSTGGGIKTTTLAVLVFGTMSILRGKNRIEYSNRSIPFTVLNRAIIIVFFSFVFVILAVIALSITEDAALRDIMFEAFSAFGTVGLSTGLTAQLSFAGKIIITIAMFMGRLGALTLALAITAPGSAARIEYPSENVMVG